MIKWIIENGLWQKRDNLPKFELTRIMFDASAVKQNRHGTDILIS